MLSKITFFVLFICSSLSSFGATVLDNSIRNQLVKSIVQVQAIGCSDGSRTATGFVWGAKSQIVTALHVVAGCSVIRVIDEKDKTYAVSITKSLLKSDLALLKANTAISAPLKSSLLAPATGTSLEAVGYIYSAPTPTNKLLVVAHGSAKLSDMLPNNVLVDISQKTSIDTKQSIIRLNGHLLPGLSGAPIFGSKGKIVAIGMGGLKKGAAAVSYAIPAIKLENLIASTDSSTSAGISGSLFSHTPLTATNVSLECGDVEFVYIGTRTFKELKKNADYQNNLSQIVNTLSQPFFGYHITKSMIDKFEYDVYMPVEKGAIIAVPKSASIEERDGYCWAKIDTQTRLMFAGLNDVQINNSHHLPSLNSDFTNAFDGFQNDIWHDDDETRRNDFYFDGQPLLFTRAVDNLAVYRQTMAANSNNFLQKPAQKMYKSAVAKEGIMIAMLGFNLNRDMTYWCAKNKNAPQCSGFIEILKNNTAMSLGMNISTFPVN
jgi:S1-C subfamily serine protease